MLPILKSVGNRSIGKLLGGRASIIAAPAVKEVVARHAEQQDAFRGVFELPASDVPVASELSEEAAGQAPDAAAATSAHAGGHDRLELAIAYLDLGDAQTARSLLEEVARSDDPHLQAQARELLARLG